MSSSSPGAVNSSLMRLPATMLAERSLMEAGGKMSSTRTATSSETSPLFPSLSTARTPKLLLWPMKTPPLRESKTKVTVSPGGTGSRLPCTSMSSVIGVQSVKADWSRGSREVRRS